MLAAQVALISLISSPVHMSSEPAAAVADGFRPSPILRWQLLLVPLTAWYFERTVYSPKTFFLFARTKVPNGLVAMCTGRFIPE